MRPFLLEVKKKRALPIKMDGQMWKLVTTFKQSYKSVKHVLYLSGKHISQYYISVLTWIFPMLSFEYFTLSMEQHCLRNQLNPKPSLNIQLYSEPC